MAPFLDHVISFQTREEPHKLARFTNEDYLSSHHALPGLNSLHRSGIQIQQCFNVLGMEYDKYDDIKWKQRQIAAYHSFDLQHGRSTWIIMKGNDTIRERIQESTKASLAQHPETSTSLACAFYDSLRSHMMIIQWGSENWSQYIDSLEAECTSASMVTEFKNIDILADDIFARRTNLKAKRTMSIPPKATNSSLSQSTEKSSVSADSKASPVPGLIRRISSKISTSASFPLMRGLSTPLLPISAEVVNKNLDLAALVKFQSPQRLNQLAKNILAAKSIIEQNKRVFSDIRTRYQELTESSLFGLNVSNADIRRRCEDHAADFIRKLRRLESDLDSHQIRLDAILYKTEQASEMVS